MSITANWSYPTAIRFGAGRISEIADACAAAGMTRPLLITDRGLANMDITTKTLDVLEAAGLGRAMFADVDPNPNEKNAAAGVKAYKDKAPPKVKVKPESARNGYKEKGQDRTGRSSKMEPNAQSEKPVQPVRVPISEVSTLSACTTVNATGDISGLRSR